MSKRAGKVYKEFSALKRTEEINFAAIQIFQIVFRGEQETAFEPKKGTQLYRVWHMMKLDMRQQLAWHRFRQDCDKAAGKSGPVTASYGDYVDGDGDHLRVPTAYTNAAYKRVEAVFRTMGRRDRALLWDLLQDDLRAGSPLRLEYIGFIRAGYSEEEKARTAGVVLVQNVLDRLADLYGI